MVMMIILLLLALVCTNFNHYENPVLLLFSSICKLTSRCHVLLALVVVVMVLLVILCGCYLIFCKGTSGK